MLSEPEVLEPPATEPITLEQAKTFLRIDGDALDGEIELMAIAAREDVELLTGLLLIDQTVRVQAGDPWDLDHLTVGPVKDFLAIGSLQPDGTIDPLPIEAFELTGSGLDRGIRPVGNVPGLAARPIVVDLVVGFSANAAAVPASLRLLLLQMLRARYDDKAVDVERLVTNYRVNA